MRDEFDSGKPGPLNWLDYFALGLSVLAGLAYLIFIVAAPLL